MKLRFAFLILFLVIVAMLLRFVSAAEDPIAIVARSDAIRAPGGSYEFEAVVTTYEGEEKKSENGYKGYVKDLDHVLVEFKSPPSERGKSLLMLGDDLWIYLPNIKKPVRIPLQQRLVGDVSNGDMARSKFAVDYNAVLNGEENMTGQETYVLDLVAKSENKTYNKIKYWIAKGDSKPVKAEFFTVSGQSLKTCTFEDFRSAAGAVRPMRLVFQDTINKNQRSTLIFSSMTQKKLDDRMFTKEYMSTLE
jgi:outer membrane lipoprotein-sorting protein